MDIYYINSKNEKIDLNTWPYVVQNPETLYAHEWKYESSSGSYNGISITRFYRDSSSFKPTLAVFADSDIEYEEAMKKLSSVMEYDILNNSPGKLYVNGSYVSCFVIAKAYSDYEELFNSVDCALSILATYPFWITETKKEFFVNNHLMQDGYDFPYDFPYDLCHDKTYSSIVNDGISASPFKMIIYGPCVNPSIRINGHLYELKITLYEREYAVIDSRDNIISKYNYKGVVENIFNSRNKASSVFEPIPPGVNSVNWNTSFGFDITLYKERSESRWTS